MLGGAEHDDELAKQADPGRPEDAGVGEEVEHVHEPGGAHEARHEQLRVLGTEELREGVRLPDN